MKFTSQHTYRQHNGEAEIFDVTMTVDEQALARMLGARLFTRDANRNFNLTGIASATMKKAKPDGQ